MFVRSVDRLPYLGAFPSFLFYFFIIFFRFVFIRYSYRIVLIGGMESSLRSRRRPRRWTLDWKAVYLIAEDQGPNIPEIEIARDTMGKFLINFI